MMIPGGIFGRSALGEAGTVYNYTVSEPGCDMNSPEFAPSCPMPFAGDGQGHPPQKLVDSLTKKKDTPAMESPPRNAPACPAGQVMSRGQCITPGTGLELPPSAQSCPAGQISLFGQCIPDPKSVVGSCPGGISIGGQCVSLPTPGPLQQPPPQQFQPKTDYTLPIVVGVGVLAVGLGAFFLLRKK